MWGRYIENELHEGTKKAKTEAQAMSRAKMIMQRILFPPEVKSEDEEEKPAPVSKGQFRDPAPFFAKE